MPLKTRDVEAQLQHKFSFVHSETNSVDHRWYSLTLPGRVTIKTKVSHGPKEIHVRLISAMAGQVGVNAKFFEEMIRCTKSCSDYLQKLGLPQKVVDEHCGVPPPQVGVS